MSREEIVITATNTNGFAAALEFLPTAISAGGDVADLAQRGGKLAPGGRQKFSLIPFPVDLNNSDGVLQIARWGIESIVVGNEDAAMASVPSGAYANALDPLYCKSFAGTSPPVWLGRLKVPRP